MLKRNDSSHGSGPSPNVRAPHRVVIIGGGAAGGTVAATLLREKPGLDVAIIEPSERHFYQPGWTLVGGGEMRLEDWNVDPLEGPQVLSQYEELGVSRLIVPAMALVGDGNPVEAIQQFGEEVLSKIG